MKLNPWLREKLGVVDPRTLEVLIEVEPGRLDYVRSRLSALGVRVKGTALGRFILAAVPVEMLDAVERIEGVVMIHYNAPVWIKPSFPFSIALERFDALVGNIMVSRVEIPSLKLPSPVVPFGGFGLPKIKRSDVEIIPTSATKPIVVDADVSVTGAGVKVAVIDTGAPMRFHPQWIGRRLRAYTTIPEPPWDAQGHGSWCTSAAFGSPAGTRFGRVEGMAPGTDVVHVKALSTFGFGSTFSVLKAMEKAIEEGAKVISMSLGGVLQGSVEDDPQCRVISEYSKRGHIFVIAAGNEGPDEWTIGSPGACVDALTVGAYSSVYGDVAVYSSRGSSGEWYKEHQDVWREHLEKYGDLIVKPDVIAPGGGPVRKDQKPVDLLYSGSQGWFDGFYDLLADGYEAMRGTSMATPHVAGVVALIAEAVPNIRVYDIKRVLMSAGSKDHVKGWGMFTISGFVR